MFAYVMTAALAAGWVAPNPMPLQWETSYGKALEATRADNQPLLVVLDRPQAADARIEPALLSEGAAEGHLVDLLRPYQLCHVDVSTEYGQKVAEVFKAKSFPYVAIIDKTGSVIIYSKAGKVGGDDWERVLATHKSGERPRTPISRVSYKPNQSIMFQNPTGSYMINSSSCPSCQQRSF